MSAVQLIKITIQNYRKRLLQSALNFCKELAFRKSLGSEFHNTAPL